MTDEERREEGAEEGIEDLEAPGAAQEEVVGGLTRCQQPTCVGNTDVSTFCRQPTCKATKQDCQLETAAVVIHEL
jgi:hypothetical protein